MIIGASGGQLDPGEVKEGDNVQPEPPQGKTQEQVRFVIVQNSNTVCALSYQYYLTNNRHICTSFTTDII